jgi:hypothetical protein
VVRGSRAVPTNGRRVNALDEALRHLARGGRHSGKLTEPLSIRLAPTTRAALQTLADKEDRSLSYIIQRACDEYVDRVTRKRAKAKPGEAN